jgi:SNF2 family DNA or RNA helicase
MALKAEYKWGLTGTPTPNGIEEVFPYLKFIDHPGVTTIREFKKKYVGGRGRKAIPDEQRFERLRELLAPVMIMRTPSHSFLGKTLLRLPKGHPLPPILVKFSAEEDIIYRFIEKNIQDHIMNKAAQKGKKVGWAALKESLIRLRQCVACPLLLENLAKEGFWSAGDVATMKKDARDAGCETTPFIDQIERWNLKSNLGRASTTPGFVMPETTLMNAKAALDATTCPGRGCMKAILQLTEPQISECGHVWCKVCLEDEIQFEKLIKKKEIPECGRCGKPLGQAKPFSPAEPGQQIARPLDQHLNSQKRPGEDYNGKLPRGSNLMDLLNQDPGMKMPRSGKVDAVIRQVVAWQTEDPEGKIISMYTNL